MSHPTFPPLKTDLPTYFFIFHNYPEYCKNLSKAPNVKNIRSEARSKQPLITETGGKLGIHQLYLSTANKPAVRESGVARDRIATFDPLEWRRSIQPSPFLFRFTSRV